MANTFRILIENDIVIKTHETAKQKYVITANSEIHLKIVHSFEIGYHN